MYNSGRVVTNLLLGNAPPHRIVVRGSKRRGYGWILARLPSDDVYPLISPFKRPPVLEQYGTPYHRMPCLSPRDGRYSLFGRGTSARFHRKPYALSSRAIAEVHQRNIGTTEKTTSLIVDITGPPGIFHHADYFCFQKPTDW